MNSSSSSSGTATGQRNFLLTRHKHTKSPVTHSVVATLLFLWSPSDDQGRADTRSCLSTPHCNASLWILKASTTDRPTGPPQSELINTSPALSLPRPVAWTVEPKLFIDGPSTGSSKFPSKRPPGTPRRQISPNFLSSLVEMVLRINLPDE